MFYCSHWANNFLTLKLVVQRFCSVKFDEYRPWLPSDSLLTATSPYINKRWPSVHLYPILLAFAWWLKLMHGLYLDVSNRLFRLNRAGQIPKTFDLSLHLGCPPIIPPLHIHTHSCSTPQCSSSPPTAAPQSAHFLFVVPGIHHTCHTVDRHHCPKWHQISFTYLYQTEVDLQYLFIYECNYWSSGCRS